MKYLKNKDKILNGFLCRVKGFDSAQDVSVLKLFVATLN